MAQSGQLQARVEESQVKDMLAKTSTTRAEKKVTITRRNVMSDDEDNDDDLL
jgi:DNA-binding TFAR19-related protein (PDSD5 family)